MTMQRLLLVWVMLAVLMTANGAFRELALVRVVGRSAADVVSAALGIAIILVATRPFLRPLSGRLTMMQLAAAGLIWLGLTVAFEFLFGHYVDRKSWSTLAENYAIWRGKLWPIVLVTVVAAPFIWVTPRR